MRRIFGLLIFLGIPLSAVAQPQAHRLLFNATAPAPAPQPVPTQLGTNRAPDGEVLAVNSQYLTRNGKPWIPVMGEFHFSRYPEAYWEEEILKMKASGVQVIATYVFWLHVEEVEGRFDWSGQNDLRKFAELCAKHGMLLYPRIGPWAHGEARNGGLPDWVLKNSAVRSNNPVYLAEVRQFYAQIGEQLKGLLWKDGGPVIGIQIENEYSQRGPGQGREHLATLKRMAQENGLDVPLYTVTGWDNATVPDDLFLPVYGGYPDAPWGESRTELPPSEVYAFRFASRVASNMGAMPVTEASAVHTAGERQQDNLRSRVPFLTAEIGGGMQDTYHRRPVLTADDIDAMIPVILGSGANLLGYYMYHGGENPDGKLSTLQESQRTNYPNDLPVKSYDFQAPLGEFGQMRASLRELKLYHYFLQDFGAQLAPMRVIAPAPRPGSPADMSVPRASLRMQGERGFLFVNNHVREYQMPAWPATQFEIHAPQGTILVPAHPVTLPADSYFYWPVNLDLGGVPLRYATAQPVLKTRANGEDFVFFAATDGIPVEFAFPAEDRGAVQAGGHAVTQADGLVRLENVAPAREVALTVHGRQGVTHVVVLSAQDAKNLWRVSVAGQPRLLLTHAQVFSEGGRVLLRQMGENEFDAEVFEPAPGHARTAAMQPLFRHVHLQTPRKKIALGVEQARGFGKAPEPLLGPSFAWRSHTVAMAPDEASFADAAQWRVTLPKDAMQGLSDAYLTVRYQGDEARLLSGEHLLADDFYNGKPWRIGLKRFLAGENAGGFLLQILPLSPKAAIFFEPGMAPTFRNGQAGALESLGVVPEYQAALPM